jgi:hypothetical protein
VKRHTDKIKRVQERWRVRRAFENDQDAALVAKSFRDIGILMNAFQVNDSAEYETRLINWIPLDGHRASC